MENAVTIFIVIVFAVIYQASEKSKILFKHYLIVTNLTYLFLSVFAVLILHY